MRKNRFFTLAAVAVMLFASVGFAGCEQEVSEQDGGSDQGTNAAAVREVTGKELNELVAAGKTVVCDFFATWCGPCKMLGPIMEALSGEFPEAIFVKVDTDENAEVAASFHILSIPDVYVFSGGEVKAHNLGYLPKEQMREFLKNNL